MSDERLAASDEDGQRGGQVEQSVTLAAPLDNERRRGLLVLNPKATAASERTGEVLVGALSSALELNTVRTERRGHGTDLARWAMEDGVDVVIAFGGDGTVNEVVTGLLTNGPGPQVPALAVIPADPRTCSLARSACQTTPSKPLARCCAPARAAHTARVGRRGAGR